VTLALTTHDSGGITRRDIELAKQIAAVTEGSPAAE
jgi:pterin-4a-carbinolamine dehydratase